MSPWACCVVSSFAYLFSFGFVRLTGTQRNRDTGEEYMYEPFKVTKKEWL